MNIFGLMDCNNFFVSCERVFDPKLINQPVLVLSSGDGCVVARSQETKKFGIDVGVPVFKIRKIVEKEKIILRPANLNLYRDMSIRVMNILKEFAGPIEIYSIDEAFFDLNQVPNAGSFSKELKNIIYQYTGIPVSIGIAETKTLSKLANRVAKSGSGVFEINHENRYEILKRNTPIEIWGIGKRNADKLSQKDIKTAYDLQIQTDEFIKKKFSKNIFFTIQELRGHSIFKLNLEKSPRKSIISSKSFAVPVISEEDLRIALTEHLESAVRQLRLENLVTKKASVYISTSLHTRKQYERNENILLERATNDTLFLTKQIKLVLKKIYRPGFNYKKTGICLSKISSVFESENLMQNGLFTSNEKDYKGRAICETIDKINEKYDSQLIKMASSRLNSRTTSLKCSTKKSIINSGHKPLNYTTDWSEIFIIK